MASDLNTFGVAVVRVWTEEQRKVLEAEFFDSMDSYPEYIAQGREVQRVLGGFGAFGNPSSFHDPTVRQHRVDLTKQLTESVFRPLAGLVFEGEEGARVEALFDRVCVRYDKFLSPSAESWHRDVCSPLPRTLPGGKDDLILGGWSNLSGTAQSLVALVGAHDVDTNMRGFWLFSKEEMKELDSQLSGQAGRTYGDTIVCNSRGEILVPPGCAVLFRQTLAHAVKGGRQPSVPSLRVYHGYRITASTTPLIDQSRAMEEGGVPKLPSWQTPPMFSVNHYSAFASDTKPKWRSWGQQVFRFDILTERTTGKGHVYYLPTKRDRTMPSLRQMGLWEERFQYSEEEKAVMSPQLM